MEDPKGFLSHRLCISTNRAFKFRPLYWVMSAVNVINVSNLLQAFPVVYVALYFYFCSSDIPLALHGNSDMGLHSDSILFHLFTRHMGVCWEYSPVCADLLCSTQDGEWAKTSAWKTISRQRPWERNRNPILNLKWRIKKTQPVEYGERERE